MEIPDEDYDALYRDALRYRWLKMAAPSDLALIAWRVPAARTDEVNASGIDTVIDAAIGHKPE